MADLLAEVLAAHGGREEWRRAKRVSATVRFGGLAFLSRWRSGNAVPRRVTVAAHEPHVVFDDYPRPGWRAHFTAGRVWILDENGTLRGTRDNPREAMRSFRRQLWWDELDLLYFAGYASWNYFTTPFLLALPGVRSTEVHPWASGGEWFRCLDVEFPAAVPTHSRSQRYYFDERFMLRRFDYDPVAFATWARAAHFCEQYVVADGFRFPTRRRVVPRRTDRLALTRPTLVWIETSEVEVEMR